MTASNGKIQNTQYLRDLIGVESLRKGTTLAHSGNNIAVTGIDVDTGSEATRLVAHGNGNKTLADVRHVLVYHFGATTKVRAHEHGNVSLREAEAALNEGIGLDANDETRQVIASKGSVTLAALPYVFLEKGGDTLGEILPKLQKALEREFKGASAEQLADHAQRSTKTNNATITLGL